MVERGEHYRLVLSGDLSATHRVAQICAQTHSLPGRLMAYAPLPLPPISNLTDFIILLRKVQPVNAYFKRHCAFLDCPFLDAFFPE